LKGVGGQHHALAALSPGKDPVPIVQEAGWAPEPVWTGAENLDPWTVQSVASRYSDRATQPTLTIRRQCINNNWYILCVSCGLAAPTPVPASQHNIPIVVNAVPPDGEEIVLKTC
jgi:hypothetical protein